LTERVPAQPDALGQPETAALGGQPLPFAPELFPLATQCPPLFFRLRGHADDTHSLEIAAEIAIQFQGQFAGIGLVGDNAFMLGREFVAVAIEPAGEAQAEGAGIQLVGLALAVERDGRDEKTLSAGGQQFAMEHKAEATTFLHAEDLETFGDPLLHLGDELGAGELARGVRIGVVLLGHGHDEFEMHVEP
jgi:hypothetical protein